MNVAAGMAVMQALFEAEIAEVAGPKDKHDPNRAARPACPCRSTGAPKGVEVTRDAAMNIVEFITRHFGIDADDRCLALSTLERATSR